jgi:1,4-alpha-glucan branching enzyme
MSSSGSIAGSGPSTHPFMGANPYRDPAGDGVSFRVWAPFASAVTVAGTFNGWSISASPLASEGNGFWSADVAGARVGDQYKFYITNAAVGGPLWRMDPYVTRIVHNGGNLNGVIDTPSTTFAAPGYATPSWNELVIYEMHVRTFLPGDGSVKNADGTPIQTKDGSFIGSFDSAETKLDYFRDLGINAIELMPLGEFTGDISAGYNPAYIFAIEDEFGGADGFRGFVNAAHQRGIAVMVDVVYNHLGDSAGDMWQFDGWSAAPNKGGIYFYNDWRSHTDWGDTRFDYGRGEVGQYLRDNAMRWLQQRFADGLRWDSVGSIRNVKDQNNDPADDIPDGWSLCQWINSEIQTSQPWKISIAEDMKDNEWITKPQGAGGAGFNSQWGAGFVGTLRNSLIVPDDAARDMNAVAAMLSQRFNADAFQRVIFTESHDADSNGAQRLPEMISPGNAWSWWAKKRSTLGAAALLTAPGIPMLFMGQEFLASGWFDDDRILDWSNAWRFSGITQLYRDLIHLRRNWFNNTRGLCSQNVNVFHVNNTDKLIGLHRWDMGGAGDDVVVLLNFANKGYSSYQIGFPRNGMWRVRFNSDSSVYDAFFGNWSSSDTPANQPGLDGMPNSASIGIGPYTAVILSQD